MSDSRNQMERYTEQLEALCDQILKLQLGYRSISPPWRGLLVPIEARAESDYKEIGVLKKSMAKIETRDEKRGLARAQALYAERSSEHWRDRFKIGDRINAEERLHAYRLLDKAFTTIQDILDKHPEDKKALTEALSQLTASDRIIRSQLQMMVPPAVDVMPFVKEITNEYAIKLNVDQALKQEVPPLVPPVAKIKNQKTPKKTGFSSTVIIACDPLMEDSNLEFAGIKKHPHRLKNKLGNVMFARHIYSEDVLQAIFHSAMNVIRTGNQISDIYSELYAWVSIAIKFEKKQLLAKNPALSFFNSESLDYLYDFQSHLKKFFYEELDFPEMIAITYQALIKEKNDKGIVRSQLKELMTLLVERCFFSRPPDSPEEESPEDLRNQRRRSI